MPTPNEIRSPNTADTLEGIGAHAPSIDLDALSSRLGLILWEVDPKTYNFIYVSPQAERILGYPSEAWYKPGFWADHIHPDDRERAVAYCTSETADGRDHEFEYRMIANDGRTVWLRDSVTVVCDEHHQPVRMYGMLVDISAQRSAEQHGSEQASRYRVLINQLPALLWATDRDLHFTTIEGRLLETLDIRPKEWIGKTLYEFYGTEDPTYPALAAHLRASEGLQQDYECELQGRALGVHVEPLHDDQGTIIGTIGVALDVTERKRDERIRDEQSNRMRVLIEQLPAILWTTDRDLRFTSSDGRGLERLELKPGQMVGTTLYDFFQTTDRDFPPIASHLHALAGNEQNYETEWLERVFEVHVEPLYADDGSIIGTIGVALDITERKSAELRTRAAEERLRKITDAVPVQIAHLDSDCRYLFNNAIYEKWHLKPRSQITGHPISALIGEEAFRQIEPYTRRALNGEVVMFESSFLGQHGAISHVRTVLNPDFNEQGVPTGFYSVTMDISDRVKTERALANALERQQNLLRELNHRVKNSMAGLLSLIDLSRKREQSVGAFADAISHRVTGMTQVHALLSSSEWQSINLRALLAALLPPRAPGTFIADGPPLVVPPDDAIPLGMVLQELFSNSLMHGALDSPTGRVEVRWTVTPDQPTGGTTLELTWQESGGPRIDRTPTPSLGSELIAGFAKHDLQGSIELTYPPHGADHKLTARLEYPRQ